MNLPPSLTFLKDYTHKKLLWLLPVPILTHQIETVKAPMIALFILIFLDLITGLSAHFKEKKIILGRKLTFRDYRYGIISGGLRRTMTKGYQYLMAIMAIFIFEVFGLGGGVSIDVPLININANLTQIAAWGAAMVELKSIDENLEKVSGRSFIDSILSIFRKLKKLRDEFKS